jgi:hypothetical protein
MSLWFPGRFLLFFPFFDFYEISIYVSINCNDYATGLTGPFYEIMALVVIHWPINVTKRHE